PFSAVKQATVLGPPTVPIMRYGATRHPKRFHHFIRDSSLPAWRPILSCCTSAPTREPPSRLRSVPNEGGRWRRAGRLARLPPRGASVRPARPFHVCGDGGTARALFRLALMPILKPAAP